MVAAGRSRVQLLTRHGLSATLLDELDGLVTKFQSEVGRSVDAGIVGNEVSGRLKAVMSELSRMVRLLDAINQVRFADPALSLLADLANLDKQSRLNRPPRSGEVPRIVSVSGEQPGSGGGWRLCLRIQHKGQALDGMDIAREAMDAWRTYLRTFGLLCRSQLCGWPGPNAIISVTASSTS
jgi:hypothetical protein